ncbi:hypothetical protein ACJMK2_033754 [Sinanodonta woodiana]|uniref:Uncharacterized protein n=1 Tax=Sinanodonta woodiana TaxID=1069815 RepID=A0ABD3WSV8_SINWO
MPRKRSRTKENGENVLAKKMKTDRTEDEMFDEDCFKPIEKDGEAVLAIECGPNKAHMYLSKLYQGSKGSCVSFQGSWLTPNEFQFVSGRESAKDWKRSIRHQGLSLKILFTKGILSVRKLRENQENTTPTEQESPSRNQSGVTDTTKRTSGLHSRKASKRGKRRHGITKKLTIKAAALGVPDVAASAAEKSDGSHTGDTEHVLEAKQDQENTSDVETEIDESNTCSTDIVEGESLPEIASKEMNQKKEMKVGSKVDQVQEQKKTEDSFGETKSEDETIDDKSDGSGSRCEGEDDVKNIAMPVLCKEESMLDDEISETDIEIKTVVLGSAAQLKDERISPPHLDYCSNAMVADEAETSRDQTHLKNPSPECTNTSIGKMHDDIVLPKSPESSNLLIVNKQNSPCDSFTSGMLQRSESSKTESPEATQPIHSGPHVADVVEKASCIPKKETQPAIPSMHKSIDDKAEATVKAAALNSLITSLHRSAAKQPHHSMKEMDSHQHSGNGLRQSHDSRKSIHTVPRQGMPNIQQQEKSRSTSLGNSKMHSPSLEQHALTTTSKGLIHTNQHAVGYHNATESIPSEKPRSKADVKRHPTNPRSGEPQKSRGVGSPKINLDQSLRGFQNGVYLPDYHALHSKMQKEYNEYMTLLASAYRRPFPFIPVPVTSPSLPDVYSYSKLPENRVQSSSPLPKGISPVQPIPSYPLDYSQFYNPFPVVSPKLPMEIPPFSTIHPIPPNSKPVKVSKDTKPIQKSLKSEQIESNVVLDLSKKTTPLLGPTEKCLDYSKPLDFSRKGDKLKENGKMDLKWNSDESYIHKRHRSPNVSNSWIEKSDSVPKANDDASCKCGANCSDDIQKWTVDQVCSFLSKLEGCSMYTKTFREQGITGHLLPFLTTEQLTRCLGMKMGPALFFVQAVERKLRESRSSLSYKLCNGKVGVDVQM